MIGGLRPLRKGPPAPMLVNSGVTFLAALRRLGMDYVYVAVTGATILANGGMAAGGLGKAGFVVKNAAEVGVAPRWVPLLGALKAAGAIGLLFGLFGVRFIGTAAAAGLTAFFVAAICFHIRARVFYSIAFPGVFLALAVASLVLSIHSGPR